ncbi:hypothetical protein NFI96_017078, partial [Prochilodus magdalenae]
MQVLCKRVCVVLTDSESNPQFLDRVEVVRPDGMQILMEAASSLQDPDREPSEKVRKKKTKVHLFLSKSAIDILEHKTKVTTEHSNRLSAEQQVDQLTQPIQGDLHPRSDSYHCYLFQSKKFSHLLVSVIGDAFRANQQSTNLRGSRDLVVEALRHKNNVLQRENSELRRKLQGSHGDR